MAAPYALTTCAIGSGLWPSANTARRLGVRVIGMTGFEGGKLARLADISLHVPVSNYGVVEDAHQLMMHSLAQSMVKRLEST